MVVLGKPKTASSRLDLTQAFNSLGTTIGPKIGGLLILSAAPLTLEQLRQLTPQAWQAYRVQEAASVKMPYAVIGVLLLLLGGLIGTAKLPAIQPASDRRGATTSDTIWKHPSLTLAAIGIFAYVGAEVSIGSFLVNYFGLAGNPRTVCENGGRICFVLLGGRHDRTISGGWSLAAGEGRICPGFLRNRRGDPNLRVHARCRLHRDVDHAGSGIVQLHHVFPTIFSLGEAELRAAHRERLRPVEYGHCRCGAIVPIMVGALADRVGLHHAFVIPVICYLYILYYGLRGSRPNSERYAKT